VQKGRKAVVSPRVLYVGVEVVDQLEVLQSRGIDEEMVTESVSVSTWRPEGIRVQRGSPGAPWLTASAIVQQK